MKTTILFLTALFLALAIQAQTSKSITNITPGSLVTHLTPTELSTISVLSLIGTIDARDFKTMRDNMPKLSVVDLSDVTIAEYTGQGGTSLLMGAPVQDITYPANTIPDGAFYEGFYFNENKNLSYVNLPSSITSIGNSAFFLCNNLSSINIPSTVTSIGYQAFKYCSSLTSITIPASVISIGDEAFSDCVGLKSIAAYPIIPVTLTSSNVFYKVDKTTCALHVPIKSLSMYQSADVWNDFLNVISIPLPTHKTIDNLTPGSLITQMDAEELSIMESLTLSGTIDARDFKTMRDTMPNLARVDLRNIIIADYTGEEGTDQRDENNRIVAYPANTIPTCAFQNRDSLTSVTLPVSLSAIGLYAFEYCKHLEYISIPRSVTSIGNVAFGYCTALTSISLPSSLKTIGANAFLFCDHLKDIILPSSLTTIGDGVFQSCTQLKSIIIPPSVTSISDSAFGGCSGLKSVYIPKSVHTIGLNAFSSCDSLKSIVIPNSVTTIKANAFSNCHQLISVTIPASVTIIGDSIFYNCTQLTSITAYPKTPVELPSPDVFYGVDKTVCTLYVPSESLNLYQSANIWKDFLKVIAILSSTHKTLALFNPGSLITRLTSEELNAIASLTLSGTIDASDFTIMRDSMLNLAVIDLAGVTIAKYSGLAGPRGQWERDYPADMTPHAAFEDKFSLTKVVLPSSIHTIGIASFEGCSNLSSVNIPSSVTIIGNGAFGRCESLSSVTIPETVTSIGVDAFYYCLKLKSVSIPDSVNWIGDGAFSGCASLTSIKIPSFVTYIGANAFWGCSGIKQITIPESVTHIGNSAFSESSALINVVSENPNYLSINGVLFNKSQTTLIYCPNSKSGNYTIPPTVKTIKNDAFSKCGLLSSVSIPASVDSIGIRAFFYCTGINKIDIHPTVKYIGDGAFDSCYGLTSFSIPDSLTRIEGSTFFDCRGLKSISIPNSVKSICNYSFYNCSQLKSISFINSSVTIIGSYAFANCCCGLTEITIPNSVKTIKKGAFYNCSNLTSVIIPASIITMEDEIFYNCTKLSAIYAYPVVPVSLLSDKVFNRVDKSTCSLYVPAESLNMYKSANVWKDFLKIEAIIPLAIKNLSNSTVTVWPNPAKDVLYITGATGVVSIYNINGRLEKTQLLEYNSSIDISSLTSGMYVLVVDGKSFKIMKKE